MAEAFLRILALLAPLQTAAASPRWSRLWKASLAAVAAGAAADSVSSWGRCQRNPVLANGSGRFSARGLAIKLAVTGVVLGNQYRWLRHRQGDGPSKAAASLNVDQPPLLSCVRPIPPAGGRTIHMVMPEFDVLPAADPSQPETAISTPPAIRSPSGAAGSADRLLLRRR